MPRTPASVPPPALLPLGTVVGPWRVVAWAGQGVHGAVYRAVRIGHELADPVALKVALLPRDPRFAREVALHSHLEHPSIPRLMDAGDWQHPGGTLHPYIATEWVDGVPLYDWARENRPDSQQVLRLLAQLASALQAVHARGALHRDVKGDNVLVRCADSRAVLIDFGSGIYAGAPTLTPQILPPGTPAYRAPEAWLFELQFGRDFTARYRAAPADDLYALGVTACRLVTSEYPELGEPSKDENGLWRLETVVPPPALLLGPSVGPQLRTLILRMLSVRPEDRGTPGALAEALEKAAKHPAPMSTQGPASEAGLPLSPVSCEEMAPADPKHGHDNPVDVPTRAPQETTARAEPTAKVREETSRARGVVKPIRPQAHARSWSSCAALAAGLALVVGVWSSAVDQREEAPAPAQAEATGPGQPDAGTVGLGDSAATASTENSPSPPTPEGMTEDTPPEPQPGQTRPDAKGRCPRKQQIPLNRGCWLETLVDRDGCAELGGQMFKGTCYVPFISPGRQPTSKPADQP